MAITEGVQVLARRRGGKAIEFDFSDPEESRRFFREFRFPNGKCVELIRQQNGIVINILMLDDFSVTEWAAEIHAEYYLKGVGYLEPTEIH